MAVKYHFGRLATRLRKKASIPTKSIKYVTILQACALLKLKFAVVKFKLLVAV